MLSYIASNPMEDLIKGVCEELNITILSKIGEIDFLQYIKETKVNFKLIKYIIIELKSLKGTEENIINRGYSSQITLQTVTNKVQSIQYPFFVY